MTLSSQGRVARAPVEMVFGGSKEGIYEDQILQRSRGSLCFQAGKRFGTQTPSVNTASLLQAYQRHYRALPRPSTQHARLLKTGP